MFAERLAKRGTEELHKVCACRKLTVLLSVGDFDRGHCRLFVITNFEPPQSPPRHEPCNELQSFELDLTSPLVAVHGCPGAVPRWKKNELLKLMSVNAEPQTIRNRLATLNQHAAKHPLYKEVISEGCWVSSLFSNGRQQATNYGLTPGLPSSLLHGFDMSAYVEANCGSLSVFQSASFHGFGVPTPPPTGEPRQLSFASPSTTLFGIGRAHAGEFPKLSMDGREGTISLLKNEQVSVVIAAVTLEVDPDGDDGVSLERQTLQNGPTIDGAHPRRWDYSFDLHGALGAYTLQIYQCACALRTAHCPGIKVLGPTEELVLVAPVSGIILHATPENSRITADVIASFQIRDFPELTVG